MYDHSSIQLQFERLFNRVVLATLVARLLQHAKDPVVAFDVVIGPIDVFPAQKHDHLLEDVLADFLERLGQKRVGLVLGGVHHAGATIAGALFRDARFKEPIKLLVESPKQRQFRGDGDHQCQIISVLFTKFRFFAYNEVLMLPDEGGLLLLGHPLAAGPLGFLTRTSPASLAPFVALAFETIFDRPHPVENELVDLFDDMEKTELML